MRSPVIITHADPCRQHHVLTRRVCVYLWHFMRRTCGRCIVFARTQTRMKSLFRRVIVALSLSIIFLSGIKRIFLSESLFPFPKVSGQQVSVNCPRVKTVSAWPIVEESGSCGCRGRVTIITAYFNIGAKSKHSNKDFRSWNSNFFGIPDNMVIFTDDTTSGLIVRERSKSLGCTIVFIENLFETKLGNSVDWTVQHDLDAEKVYHSPEAYIIWNQKSIWVAEVASRNPYASTHFFWADSGQFRDKIFLNAYLSPAENWISSYGFIPTCKMVFLAIQKFELRELTVDERGRSFPLDSLLVRLGGGNFGGDRCAVLKWRDVFLKEFAWYMKNGVFVGKDQPIYGSACITHRDMCFIVDGSKVKQSNDIWFAMQPVLHGVTHPVPQYVLPPNKHVASGHPSWR